MPASSDAPVFHFVGGKGGVGKTTCAAMAALEAQGRVLLVTTDPASSLSAALGVTVTSRPRAVAGAARLFAANVDAARAFERWLAPRKPLVAQIAIRGTYLDDEDVARLLKLSLPGIDEVIGLIEVLRLSAGFDRVVVDTAPTGHTLRLLAAPVLLDRAAALLDGLQAQHRAVVSALRGAYRADAADTLIADLHREGAALAALLRAPATTLAWVTLPEPMALEETVDAIGTLAAAGIRVRHLIVNRLTMPPRGACEWCDARRRFEARALTPVARRFAAMRIVSYPETELEPHGVTRLRRLAMLRRPWLSPRRLPPIAHRVRATSFRAKGGRPAKSPAARQVTFAREVKWILFAGKGGVGKSTCAAAVALALAETRRVLLLSTDPAHSLGDVLGQRFDNTPRRVAAVATLDVREIDAREEMNQLRRRYVEAVDEAFARIARAGGDQGAFRNLIDLAPPGIDEVIAIADVAEEIAERKDGYEVIVTDTAPTGHALRLLQTPAVLREWTHVLMAILLKYREIVGAGRLAELLLQLSKRLRVLQDVLIDPVRTQVMVVTRPAATALDESRYLVTSLGRLGIAVAGIVVNAAGRGTCRRCRSIAGAQAAEVDRLGGAYAIIEAPAEVPPPHGAVALRAWHEHWRQRTS